ncbi:MULTISPECIES: Ig-like domain-containing protein [unclassified Robiginitalea]|uniref:Ig-like domain-containing protein n=1 Tax=Robiginitalea TaxID=252306 RepID=UPI00234ACBEC|nr:MULTISPECIES: Ig-like domain-containing protein [unclassified Robiginitalea]MDC6352986.1 Ig-like domain-containing protein [Robiginitalea sp. PM2]MDC6373847.1 Ig-like domain-containing protein [Robiginitalea sp. SP8]
MEMLRRLSAALFALFLVLALIQCGRRGTPSGGPKDVTPPVLERADPPNRTTNFDAERIRLYFDEYIRVVDLDKQLIISPPLKYPPEITPLGNTAKYLQVKISDTLLPNTTYTLNFGQSVVDNNEQNPYNLLTYVFSTGDYIDSLSLTGVVSDAYNLEPDPFISVMLYELDSAYTDSTIYKKPPYYLTNTLDSAVIFRLENLKAGRYKLFAIRDEAKNNVFNPNADKIGFVEDTITLPTDSTYVLTLFRETPAYSARKPTYAADNRILFPYTGGEAPELRLLTPVPDSVRTLLARVPDKDSLNFWFTPWEPDSMVFTLRHPRLEERIDTFSVKPLDVPRDSLRVSWSGRGQLTPLDSVYLESNLPLVATDTSRLELVDQDTVPVPFSARLDTVYNRLYLAFEKQREKTYSIRANPGALTDFFGDTNDTLVNRYTMGSPTEFGTLRLQLAGATAYPMLVEITDRSGNVIRSRAVQEAGELSFPWLRPDTYRIRVVFDTNGNGKWDTGSYLERRQPERVAHYPAPVELRANWEKVETFTIRE